MRVSVQGCWGVGRCVGCGVSGLWEVRSLARDLRSPKP